MYSTYLLICFAVIGGVLTSPQNGCDLKLDEVFRTPKDFSKVNFDHFEIVERNNFENTSPSTTQSDVSSNTIDHPSKPVANAQVMLRFGGDNIHGCHGIPISTSRFEKPCETREVRPLCHKSLPLVTAPAVSPYSEYRYPAYPEYLPTTSLAYPYPRPPYDFPGYYYGVRPLPAYIRNPYTLYNGQVIPSERIVEPYERIIPTEEICDERDSFLGRSNPSKVPCTGLPRILESENLSEEIQDINIPDIQNTPKVYVKDKIYLTNQGRPVVEETIIDSAPNDPIVTISNPDVAKISKIDGSIVDPIPYPHRVSYLETNLQEAERETAFRSSPKQNIQTLLDQALVPISCQNCQAKRKLLVTYPITSYGRRLVAIPEEEIEVPQCPCCEHQDGCGCCNRERNISIPYGKRFAADLDTLLQVVPPVVNCASKNVPHGLYRSTPCDVPAKIYPIIRDSCSIPERIDSCTDPCLRRDVEVVTPCRESVLPLPPSRILNQVVSAPSLSTPSGINQVVNVPSVVYGGYRTTSKSYYSVDNPHSQRTYVDGIATSSGAEYYDDPVKSIIYKKPAITKIVSVKNPILPVVEETNIVEPQLYEVIPKYDIIPGAEVPSLNIPELLPTNRYLCSKCNNLIPPTTVCRREYLPVERRVPLVPREVSCLPGIRDVPLIREAPLVRNYVSHRCCPTCAKYEGELNELSSRE